jgi:hypothetical protein
MVAKVRYDKHSISLKLSELNYLLAKISILDDQLGKYILAQTDVIIQATATKCAKCLYNRNIYFVWCSLW